VSDPSLAAVFQALPGAGFIATARCRQRIPSLASAGAELRLVNGVTAASPVRRRFANTRRPMPAPHSALDVVSAARGGVSTSEMSSGLVPVAVRD